MTADDVDLVELAHEADETRRWLATVTSTVPDPGTCGDQAPRRPVAPSGTGGDPRDRRRRRTARKDRLNWVDPTGDDAARHVDHDRNVA